MEACIDVYNDLAAALSERDKARKAQAKVEAMVGEMRAVVDVVKGVMASRSVICFDSEQLEHIYVSVDGALLVKVREALDVLKEKP